MSKRAWAGCVVGALAALSGCGGGFFIDTNTTTTGTSAAGNYVYTVNPVTNTLNQYALTTGTLTAISGSPLALTTSLAGASVTVSRADTFVYVGGSDGISVYNIGSTGALTLNAATAATAQQANFVSLETSPIGSWLLALDSLSLQVLVYSINTSNGALNLTSQVPLKSQSSGTETPHVIRISPNGAFVAVANGANGDEVFTFNTNNGALTQAGGVVGLSSSNSSDNGVQFDSTSAYLYVSRGVGLTGQSFIQSFAVNANGVPTANATVFPAGDAPSGLLLESGGSYLYSANRGSSNISGYTATTGTLAALPGSPFGSSQGPFALVEDKTNKYVIVASGSGTNDLTVDSIGVLGAGQLSAASSVSSGAAGVTGLAATH